ncbi:MAG: ferrochelatase [Planctomycetota bacterium]
MANAKADSVLLVAFGGPTPGCCKERDPCPGEAYCFVHGILGKSAAREKRTLEVAEHYKHLGGFSPFNALTFDQAKSLEAALAERGLSLPVVAGMRHWKPYVQESLQDLAARGCKSPLAVIMAPHQSTVSWDWYIKVVGEAEEALGAASPKVAGYLDPWWTHEGFVTANADRIRAATKGWEKGRFEKATLIFTAHAIPLAVQRTAPYEKQFKESATAIAKELGKAEHLVAYQSQPGDSAIPWSKPAAVDVIEEQAKKGVKDIVLSPIGFLCDHVEVLYDLDVEAKEKAQSVSVGYTRAETVGSHPRFIAMLADLIAARVR